MKKSIFLMAICLATLSYESKAEQTLSHEGVQQAEKVNLSIRTTNQRTYYFYSTADFVAASKPLDGFYLKMDNTISFDGNTVIVAGYSTTRYQVQSFEHSKGPVFKNNGREELYTIIAKEQNEDGTLSKWAVIITIAKVTAKRGSQTIVKIPDVAPNGELLRMNVYTD